MGSVQYTEGRIRVEPGAPPLGALAPGHARVRVSHVGLCGTDLHIVHGHMDARVPAPLVFGHEASGTIEEVAPDVTGWPAGTPVTVMPLVWDGTCPACLAGHQHICHNLRFLGIDSAGALQSVWDVPAATLLALPAGLDLASGALCEPLAVAVHDVRRSGLVEGDRTLVMGAGPIGALISLVARSEGAVVAIVEPDARRRVLAEGLGLTVVDPGAAPLEEWVEKWTGGVGADVVFEVSGAASAVAAATSVAKVRGTIVVVAIHPEPRLVDLHRVFWRELRLLGARVYERRDYERAIEILASSALPVDAIVTKVVGMTEVAEAMTALTEGDHLKVLVDVRGTAW